MHYSYFGLKKVVSVSTTLVGLSNVQKKANTVAEKISELTGSAVRLGDLKTSIRGKITFRTNGYKNKEIQEFLIQLYSQLGLTVPSKLNNRTPGTISETEYADDIASKFFHKKPASLSTSLALSGKSVDDTRQHTTDRSAVAVGSGRNEEPSQSDFALSHLVVAAPTSRKKAQTPTPEVVQTQKSVDSHLEIIQAMGSEVLDGIRSGSIVGTRIKNSVEIMAQYLQSNKYEFSKIIDILCKALQVDSSAVRIEVVKLKDPRNGDIDLDDYIDAITNLLAERFAPVVRMDNLSSSGPGGKVFYTVDSTSLGKLDQFEQHSKQLPMLDIITQMTGSRPQDIYTRILELNSVRELSPQQNKELLLALCTVNNLNSYKMGIPTISSGVSTDTLPYYFGEITRASVNNPNEI